MTVENFKQFTKKLEKKITFNTENLYEHRISLDWGTFNKQIKFNIYNNYAFPMNSTQVKDYLHNYAKPSSASDWNNKKGLIPCSGFYTNASGTTMRALYIGEYYNTTNISIMCESVALPKTSESNPISSYSPDGNIYVSDYVVCIALNNVNKPSYKTVNTVLSLGGASESSANVNWTCYKYPLGDGKFKYEWVGRYSQNKTVEVTTSYGSGFMSKKFAITLPDNNMVGKCIVYAGQSGSTCWVSPSMGGSSLDFYILRFTSTTVNNTLEINVYCSYVANS